MANAGNLVHARLKNFNAILNPISHHSASKAKTLRLQSQLQTCSSNGPISASTKRKDLQSPLIGKNTCRSPRRLITISPGDGRSHGNWTCEFLISLQDLQLQDLVEVDDRRHKNAQVYITLDIHKEHYVTAEEENNETTCWGCGLRILLPSSTPVFKCGWCGAINNQNKQKSDKKCFRWRRIRDRCFVSIIIVFMLFVIFGGVWAVYPFVFSVSLLYGIFHSIITAILSTATLSFFSLAAFRCAGTPPNRLWGSYPTIGKGDLENYTFCHYCSKPKSPDTHHCRSCGKCILDMDHHCPFIGNCVGAANHRNFIAFLIVAVFSTIYVSIMSAYAGMHIWPPLTYSLGRVNGDSRNAAWRVMSEIMVAFLRSALLLSFRGLVLVYLFVSSVSVQIGLTVLLWQQLCFIYEGKTYVSKLRSQENNGEGGEGKKDCQNLVRFFGFPYSVTRFLPNFRATRKKHIK